MSAPRPGQTDPAIIRNFCIIAHIDHGKSTLADRMLQLTGVVGEREAKAQYLDRMDIERERGITIKSQAVRLRGRSRPRPPRRTTSSRHLHPQHDRHPRSRRLHLRGLPLAAGLRGGDPARRRGQGIEAQTLANLYLAMGADLTIIPVLNKIDLPSANVEKYALELANLVGCEPEDVLLTSAKTGLGVEALLNEIVKQVPAPVGVADAPARA